MGSLLTFFSITYIVSWACFIGAATVSGGIASPLSGLARLRGPIYLLGVFVPSLVALALTARADGRAGTHALLRRIVELPAGGRWYVFAIGYIAAVQLAAALPHRPALCAWA